MALGDRDYWAATRHPWAAALFVLPLLGVYEAGVLAQGNAGPPELLRNGADLWLRGLLAALGLSPLFAAPLVLLALLLAWAWWRRRDRPRELFGVWVGTLCESVVFAVALWLLSQGLIPLLNGLHVYLNAAADGDPAVTDLISFLGAGIYEETLFRLVLFSGLLGLLELLEFPRWGAAALAGLLSALLFSLAHHVGPCAEAFEPYVFLFRTLAGLYFAALYRLRGFGVAVGAHAGYDVLVGLLLE
jgi:membrane protease YdiL (CAAX protease family)